MWRLTLLAVCFTTSAVLGYKAAVIEYFPEMKATANETILANLKAYEDYANTARSQGVDIIVFPEYGLTTVTTDLEYAIEIDDTHHVIKRLNAIALERQLYLVVNLLEKTQTGSQIHYYNTNLVFDRNGTIILKYRKINLYAESRLTPGSPNQNLTFSTDFGATFGIFTCFDILFHHPSRTVLEDGAVTDVVFPTAWVSKTPFYHSLSVQHGYAVASGVNLLAANYGKPKEGRGGSGIYLADGRIAEHYIADTASSKPIIQSVTTRRINKTTCAPTVQFGLPGDADRFNVSNYITQRAFSAGRYKFEHLDLSKNHTETQLCDRDFCCKFEVVLNTNLSNIYETYKFMIFDGMVDYNGVEAHVRTCSLVACETAADDTCGSRVNTTTRFTKLTVTGNLPRDNTSFYFPITLNYYLMPFDNPEFCSNNNDTNSTSVKLAATRQESVLAFGLFGRTDVPIEKLDDENGDGKGSAVGTRISLLGAIFVIVAAFVH